MWWRSKAPCSPVMDRHPESEYQEHCAVDRLAITVVVSGVDQPTRVARLELDRSSANLPANPSSHDKAKIEQLGLSLVQRWW